MMGGMGVCPAMALAPPQVAMIDRSADTLALTDDQKTKLSASLTKSDSALATLRQTAAAATKAVRDAVMAPTFDSARAATLLANAQKADAAISNAELQTWAEIRAILTPDQMTKLSEAMSRRMGGFQGGTGANRGTRGGTRGGNRGGQPGNPAPEAPAPDGDQ